MEMLFQSTEQFHQTFYLLFLIVYKRVSKLSLCLYRSEHLSINQGQSYVQEPLESAGEKLASAASKG